MAKPAQSAAFAPALGVVLRAPRAQFLGRGMRPLRVATRHVPRRQRSASLCMSVGKRADGDEEAEESWGDGLEAMFEEALLSFYEGAPMVCLTRLCFPSSRPLIVVVLTFVFPFLPVVHGRRVPDTSRRVRAPGRVKCATWAHGKGVGSRFSGA